MMNAVGIQTESRAFYLAYRGSRSYLGTEGVDDTTNDVHVQHRGERDKCASLLRGRRTRILADHGLRDCYQELTLERDLL